MKLSDIIIPVFVKIEFQPSYYKIGSLPIPKRLEESLLEKKGFKEIEIVNSSIKISTSLILFPIQDIAFRSNSIMLTLKKTNTLADLTKTKPATITPVIPSAETKKSISKLDSQIDVAESTLQSSKEKQVLEKIRDTLSSIATNPDYNYSSDVKEFAALYKTFTQEEKSRVKAALLANVDMDTGLKLKNMFGL